MTKKDPKLGASGAPVEPPVGRGVQQGTAGKLMASGAPILPDRTRPGRTPGTDGTCSQPSEDDE